MLDRQVVGPVVESLHDLIAMRTRDVALPSCVFDHPLAFILIHGMIFQLVHLVEVQPEALAFGAVVDIDVFELFLV
ncbi:uncharacterized protein METZ01_LOCUS59368 [marine metagenome]|uniref:Uncharacterized protein n=1 Tax=marine metagenome TaxID=408172 RepID=A0A381SSX7_9ZZZZ